MEPGADRSGLVPVQDASGLPSKYEETERGRFEAPGRRGQAEKMEDGETEEFSSWDVELLLLPFKAAIFIYVLRPEALQLWYLPPPVLGGHLLQLKPPRPGHHVQGV